MSIQVPKKFADYINDLMEADQATKESNLEHAGIDIFSNPDVPHDNPLGALAMTSTLVEQAYTHAGEVPFELACITAVAYGYVTMRLLGHPAEIIIGDLIDGEGDGYFSTDREELLAERNLELKDLGRKQNIHCWLQIAPGAIVDFTISKYMAKNQPQLLGADPRNPFHLELLHEPMWAHRTKYKPMLIGTGILQETNPQAIIDVAIDEVDLNNLPIGRVTADPVEFFEKNQSKIAAKHLEYLAGH